MATDFDFDGTFDADDEGFDEEGFDEEDDEESSGRRNPLRLILLVLFILVLLCGVCYLGSQYLPGNLLGFIPGFGDSTPAPAPATDTPAAEPTEAAPSPGPEEPIDTEEPTVESPLPTTEPAEGTPVPTEEPAEEPTAEPTVVVEPTEEAPVPTEEPTTEPTVVVVEPTEEPTLVAEPTDDTVSEHDEEPVIVPTATTVVVPGPTATPGPTVVITVTTCDNNTPPVADANGPYTAMMGKGQAIVTFDGSNSTDSDGEIVSYEWDFDDGSAVESGESVTHGYSSPGSYLVTLIVTDDCGESSLATAEVTIAGPTPPAGTSTPVVPTPSPVPPPLGTLGFCYRVQYGDTLSGIAWRFGVSWQDLAFVNRVGMGYFVIAGQGLFIPTGPITDGPNIYVVQDGDTLNSVAYHCGLTTTTLARVNGLHLDESLSPGQMLMIPPWRYR